MNIKNISIKNKLVSYKDTESNFVYKTSLKEFVPDLYARNLNPTYSAESGKWYYLQETFIQKAEDSIPLCSVGFFSNNKTKEQLEQLDKLVSSFLVELSKANEVQKTKSYSVALFNDSGGFLGCTEFIRKDSIKFKKHLFSYNDKCKLTLFQAFATKERLGLRNARIITTKEAEQLYNN